MEQFIDTVDSARTGFNRERTVNQRQEDGQFSQLHYNNVIQSLADIEMFVNEIYESQHHQAFKIQFNFGVIYEEYRHDQNDQVQVDYGYILPRDTRIQEHSPKVIQNQDDIEEYQQYIKAEIINMQNFTLDSTRQRYIAIYSMLIKTYNLQPQIVGASMKELIDLHCNGRKNVIYKNTGNNNNCYMEAVAKALHLDSKEKRYFPYEIISISKQLLVQVLELPFDSKSRKMTDLLKVFDGLDITKYVGLQIMYQCDEIAIEEIKSIDILVVESEWQGNKISHAFAIANKQALTGLQFCPHCNSKAFDPKDKNYSRDYEKHIIKCENNGGKIIKKVKLDYVQKPYCPHIMHNKTYQYLLANGRENEYKPTQYFITYDLETVPKFVNKKFGKSSYQMYELFPLSIASTIRNKQEAEQVNADNQYLTSAGTIDEKIPYSIEVPICKDWTITNYTGSPSTAKLIIVHHKKLNLKVKFVDILTYLQPMELKQAAKDFGDGYDDKKGLFLYECFNTDNVNEVLSKSEPFSMEDFNSSLKKNKISQKDYQIYLDDAKRFMSMAACSNTIKYAKACLPTNLTDIDVYHLVRKWITGGLSNVMHRVNRSGIDFIKRLWYDKDNKKVTVLTTDHRITHVVGVDFNSLYPCVMSSEPHQFIKYTGRKMYICGLQTGKMYMCGSQTGKIMGNDEHSKQTIQRIINSKKRFTADGQLFIAEVKGHIDQNYINDYINFPPILRNYDFTTDERTIDDVKQIVLFNKHDQFNSFIKEFTKNRIEAKLDENKGQEQFFKIVMNSSYGSDGMNSEKYHKVKIMNKKQTERAIRSNAFMDEQKISEDSYLVQMNPEHLFSSYTYLRSISPRLTPKQITCVNILAVLNKQVGRQAIKKIVFFE
ncbi:MAG: hypothetical protein EZS28_014457 [Streblomastix strix]|uniref:DNA-directed DNA polymerase n=1 Tax=Streblomastix strix TaxID=222440 RepID=A0A5J4W5N0_9EUKA|nr:MAG: hypothetical protein EZS28_014457 [Streblomastix strix]